MKIIYEIRRHGGPSLFFYDVNIPTGVFVEQGTVFRIRTLNSNTKAPFQILIVTTVYVQQDCRIVLQGARFDTTSCDFGQGRVRLAISRTTVSH